MAKAHQPGWAPSPFLTFLNELGQRESTEPIRSHPKHGFVRAAVAAGPYNAAAARPAPNTDPHASSDRPHRRRGAFVRVGVQDETARRAPRQDGVGWYSARPS